MNDFLTLLVFAEYDFYLDRRKLAFGKFFQLLLGLTYEENRWLTWGEVFEFDENDDENLKVRDYVRIREYKIPVPEFLKFYLQKALEENPNFSWAEKFPTQNPDEDFSIAYALRILKVNGYSDDTIKDLKTHFKIRQNSDLFLKLGISDKTSVSYNLSSIDLDNPFMPIATFPDKNFRKGYHFQKWTSFVKALFSNINYMEQSHTRIRILLLIGLYSGSRLSSLLSLQWKDIFSIDAERKFIYINKEFKIEGNEILKPRLHQIICSAFGVHLITLSQTRNDISIDSKGKTYEEFETGNFGFEYKEISEDAFSEYIFITSNGKKIIQNNLSREIDNSLYYMDIGMKGCLKANSTQIMWGRRIIEIKGDHKPTIKALMKHFKRKSKKELAEFLHLVDESGQIEFEGKRRKNVAEEMTYDIVPTNPFGGNNSWNDRML